MDKITAKETAKQLGIPVVPGSDGGVPDMDTARQVAAEMGYPVIIKASLPAARPVYEGGVGEGASKRLPHRPHRGQGRFRQ
ncbi:MAG: hypothetical protein R3D59_11460 [Paracoccaceae bacterium]